MGKIAELIPESQEIRKEWFSALKCFRKSLCVQSVSEGKLSEMFGPVMMRRRSGAFFWFPTVSLRLGMKGISGLFRPLAAEEKRLRVNLNLSESLKCLWGFRAQSRR
jgi:hypothetical protein